MADLLSSHQVVFVITVPHAACKRVHFEKGWHMCDTLAPRAAKTFHWYLKNKLQQKVYGPYEATINREDTDFNRETSRKSDFRRSLSQLVRKLVSQQKIVIVVDVHSYDKDAEWVTTEFHPEFVIMDNATKTPANPYNPNDMKLEITWNNSGHRKISGDAEILRDSLAPPFNQITPIAASPAIDIAPACKEDGAAFAVLIEMSEDKLADYHTLYAAIKVLCHGLMNVAKEKLMTYERPKIEQKTMGIAKSSFMF